MATIPTAYTWTVGELVTSAKMNAYLRDAVSFLLARPQVRLRNTIDQPITTSAHTELTFDTEDGDADGMHSTTVNTSRATIQTAGVFTFTANGGWVANSAGKRELYIRRNGSGGTTYGGSAFVASASVSHSHSVTATFRCDVGDYVDAVVWHNVGVSLSISASFHGGQRLTGTWERT